MSVERRIRTHLAQLVRKVLLAQPPTTPLAWGRWETTGGYCCPMSWIGAGVGAEENLYRIGLSKSEIFDPKVQVAIMEFVTAYDSKARETMGENHGVAPLAMLVPAIERGIEALLR